jgi:hypothetical protein
MSLTLPPVGTSQLLELVSPYVPDDCIAEVCPRHFTGGRRHALSAAQLWRTHLLAVLTSTHSLNLLVAQLPEQAAWRCFGRLRSTLPTARMLHEFRQAVGVDGLRAINHHLVGRLLRRTGLQPQAVALMDATDLPAACSGFKKKFRPLHRRTRGAGWAHAQDRPEPLVCRLQETHVAIMAAHRAFDRDACAAGQLAHTWQCGRRRPVAAESALVSSSLGLVAGDHCGRHGLSLRSGQASRPHWLAVCGSHQTARRHETRVTLCERDTSGLSGHPPNRNSVHTAGKPPVVRATLVMSASNTKRSLVYCRWPAAWPNDYYGKSVRGLNRPSPLRKTNWVWARCFSTACA